MTSRTNGSSTNYSLSQTSATNNGNFTGTSFPVSLSGGSLTGGTDAVAGTYTLSTPSVTLYQYDVLNNLTCAVQKNTDATAFTTCAAASANWRPRSFVYDSLGRLSSAKNPESSTITYTYDIDNNLTSKKYPQPNQPSASVYETINYSYDSVHRVTQKSFTGIVSPTVKYFYDGNAPSGCTTTPPTLTDSYPKGRRNAMRDGSGGATSPECTRQTCACGGW
jgi:YD repeat-containing protein